MSEYQYYEFQAIDRPLSGADRDALRALSTRAHITATRFTNSYEWGDFKGDPAALMERWFDLHLYLANWGTRRLMIRLPARLVDRPRIEAFLQNVDFVELTASGENLIVDILREETDPDDDWRDSSDWLAALGPLRADVLGGDLRMFYLLWLSAVEVGEVEPDEPEPLPGLGPMTAALEAFAEFFQLDVDLITVAAERAAEPMPALAGSPQAVRRIITAMNDTQRTDFLARLFEGDAHVANELRTAVRDRLIFESAGPPAELRTAGALRARAETLRLDRERARAEKAEAERKRQAAAAERSRRARLEAIARRGERAWQNVETDIERRNPAGYDRAADLLSDLRAIAEENGAIEDFARRVRAIRERHARKERFIERLAKLK